MRRCLTLLAAGTFAAAAAAAQSRLVAYVPTAEATTSGALSTAGDNSMLGDKSVVTTLARPAHVTLSRGGAMLVCQASVVHLTAGQAVFNPKARDNFDPLLIALDSGGIELQMPLIATDTVATSGMRFASGERNGKSTQLDLALRVTDNGDTCVENRARKSPPVTVTDAFGQSSFQLKAGEHVLFQHGLIQEALVNDPTFCGCPPPPPPPMSLADAALRAGPATPTFTQSASTYPFPAEASAGLETGAPPPDRPVQVAANLVFNADAPEPPAQSNPAADSALAASGESAASPAESTGTPADSPPTAATPSAFVPETPATSPAPTTGRRKLPVPPPPKPTAATASRPPVPPPPPPPPPPPQAPAKQSHGLGHFFKKIFGG